MTVIRHNRQEQFSPRGAYERGLSVPQDTDPDDDSGDGGDAIVKADRRAVRYLDPSPVANNLSMREAFQTLEPTRRRHLVGWIADRISPAGKFVKHLYGPTPLYPQVIWNYSVGHKHIPGKFGIRGLCVSCRELPKHMRPRKCLACTTYQRTVFSRPGARENPLFEQWADYLLSRADIVLRAAAIKEYAASFSMRVNLHRHLEWGTRRRLEAWMDEQNVLFKTRPDSPPLIYSWQDDSGCVHPSTYDREDQQP